VPAYSSASPAEQYLRSWHSRHPDASRVFSDARDSDGRSSYERLVLFASGGDSVLDVACGTGNLLELIYQAAPSCCLTGVDLSTSELQLARARVPSASLSVARAQALPLADASFDLVLCHMALMLMERPEEALAESRRVLRRGGMFSAVTQRPAVLDAVAKMIIGALRSHWEATDKSLHPPPLGDPRTFDATTLVSLVRAHFEQVVAQPFSVTQRVPRTELWPYLVNSAYGFDAIPAPEAEAILTSLALPEAVPWTVAMVQVQGRA
jgi:ubiquinone/menaquinone biosynthesis C-methylase UbiE